MEGKHNTSVDPEQKVYCVLLKNGCSVPELLSFVPEARKTRQTVRRGDEDVSLESLYAC